MEKTVNKYANYVLADLLERALSYKKLAYSNRRSSRDRAVWTALFADCARTYNYALKTYETMSIVQINQDNKLIIDKLLREKGFCLATEDEIDFIIESTYSLSKEMREAQRIIYQKQEAQQFVIVHKTPKVVQDALRVLVDHGLADQMYLDKLVENKSVESKPLPRGNPRKGGLISKYIRQGKSYSEALKRASQALDEGPRELEFRDAIDSLETPDNKPESFTEDQLKDAVSKYFGTNSITQAHEDKTRERTQSILDMLESHGEEKSE